MRHSMQANPSEISHDVHERPARRVHSRLEGMQAHVRHTFTHGVAGLPADLLGGDGDVRAALTRVILRCLQSCRVSHLAMPILVLPLAAGAQGTRQNSGQALVQGTRQELRALVRLPCRCLDADRTVRAHSHSFRTACTMHKLNAQKDA
jgi:hypothetical protein